MTESHESNTGASNVARRAAVPLAVLGGLLALASAAAGVGLGRVRGAD